MAKLKYNAHAAAKHPLSVSDGALQSHPVKNTIPPVPPIAHPLVRPEQSIVQLLNRLRTVRDSREFEKEGCHSFREWTMKQFGEKVGALVDDTI